MFQRDCPTHRIITHYYYPSWPDRGVPKDSSSLCNFTEHVRQDLEATPRLGPAVVHCRSGLHPNTILWKRHPSTLLKICFVLTLQNHQMGYKSIPFSCVFSAGVGRSGTFVTLLWLMQLCARGIRPDIRAAVADLRLHRMWMVQNLVSLVLILTCTGLKLFIISVLMTKWKCFISSKPSNYFPPVVSSDAKILTCFHGNKIVGPID